MENQEKIVFSGIKPTGSLTLGNYIGAVKNMLSMQAKYKCYYCVADLHTITIDLLPAEFRKNSYELMSLFLAFGLDPDKSVLFVQSHVPAHAELTWILNCFTQFGEAKRMTQFKDKSQKAPENVNVGLFDYPVLMAADILLYQTDYVPVGKDQLQHVELARTIAARFNNKFSPTFKEPEGINPKFGAKIFSLSEPKQKMSKSDENPNGSILLLDDADTVMRKFRKAVTDSETSIRFDAAGKPGVSNLLTIYSTLSGMTMPKTEELFSSKNYGELKEKVGEIVVETLIPIQKKFYDYMKNKDYLAEVMKKGAATAAHTAGKTLSKVYRKVGFIEN